MKRILLTVLSLATATTVATAAPLVFEGTDGPGKGKHIVFLAGDHEYRSEESLPALARILAKHQGFKCTVLFNIDPATGEIVAGNSNMPGMEALGHGGSRGGVPALPELPAGADEALRRLPQSRRPGGRAAHGDACLQDARRTIRSRSIRTTTKAPDYELGFGHQVLGQTWVGHYGKNHQQSTRITIVDGQEGRIRSCAA